MQLDKVLSHSSSQQHELPSLVLAQHCGMLESADIGSPQHDSTSSTASGFKQPHSPGSDANSWLDSNAAASSDAIIRLSPIENIATSTCNYLFGSSFKYRPKSWPDKSETDRYRQTFGKSPLWEVLAEKQPVSTLERRCSGRVHATSPPLCRGRARRQLPGIAIIQWVALQWVAPLLVALGPESVPLEMPPPNVGLAERTRNSFSRLASGNTHQMSYTAMGRDDSSHRVCNRIRSSCMRGHSRSRQRRDRLRGGV